MKFVAGSEKKTAEMLSNSLRDYLLLSACCVVLLTHFLHFR